MTLKRIVKYVFVGILAVLLLVLLLVPPLARRYINKNGKELIGRKVRIDKIHLNYFSSTLKAINFSLYEVDDVTEFVGFDTLIVNVKPLRLLKNEIYLQRLLLANPRGEIVQNDSVFNFSDLLQKPGSNVIVDQKELNEEEKEDVLFHLNLNHIEVRNGDFLFTDLVLDHTIKAENLSFKIPQIYCNAQKSSETGILFDLSDGGHVAANLDYEVKEGIYSGFLNIKGLELRTFLPYVKQKINFLDLEGSFDTHLAFSGSKNDNSTLLVSGELELNNLSVSDMNGDAVASILRNRVIFHELKPIQQKIIIDSITIDRPFASVVIFDTITTNWSKLMVEPKDTAVETDARTIREESEQSIFSFQLNNLSIYEGAFAYKDLQFDTTFVFDITHFKVEMDSVNLEKEWIDLQTSMKLNNKGSLEAKIGLNPFAPSDSFQMDYVLSNIPLSDFDLYSRHYIGYAISGGTMFFTGNTRISKKYLESKNQLNIRDIDMGDKEGGEYDVPVKTALFIVKDNNDDVQVDIPIEGDLSDTNTSIGGLIAKTLTDFVFKIIKSPFKFLGGMVGMDSGEMSQIPFDYEGVDKLNSSQKKSLDAIVQFANKKPEIKVELIYLNDKDVEAQVIAKEMAEADFEKKHKKKAENNETEYQQFLEVKTKESGLTIFELEQSYTLENKVKRMIEQREKSRIKIVENYLKKKGASSAVKLKGYDSSNLSNEKSPPILETKIGLSSQKVE